MKPFPTRGRTLLAIVAGIGLWSCATPDPERIEIVDDSALATFADSTLELSPLRFEVGGVSLNDRCPVRKGRLNRRMPPIFVNQHPVGFC